MTATHKVIDMNGRTVGFVINGHFYADYYIKENIQYIDNLSFINGAIQAEAELPEVSYKNYVNEKEYKRLMVENPFVRDIQKELTKWKKDAAHKVLQLEGSRQIGKTTEIKKFAYKNYEYVIFVDLSNDIFSFIDVVNNGCSPFEVEKYCIRSSIPHFVNNKSTVLIIDEIQNSNIVYNSIRKMYEELNCDIIVTGSYLGRILGEKEFFQPAGTISYLYMFTLSFKEFCRAFRYEKTLLNIDLYGRDETKNYKKLENLYYIYLKIGGYPEAVKVYKETKNIEACYNIIEKLLQTFKAESRVYFKNVREVEIFENVYREALKEMCNRADKAVGDGKETDIEKITAFVKKNTELLVNKNEVANAIMWLKYAGILSVCNLAVQGDIRDISYSRRTYFSDCGIVSYLASKSTLAKSSLAGVITETFVYNELHRLFKIPYKERKVVEDEVCYATYGVYELDFMVADKENVVYGIEVKTKTGEPNSLKVFIKKGLVDRGIVAKPTKGGHGEQFDTIPIYTVGCRFPYK